MERAFEDVYAIERARDVDMRTAAYMLAVSRVAEATTDARHLPLVGVHGPMRAPPRRQ